MRPSRASLLTGQYPSLHGVSQTDGLGKAVDSDDMFWLSPDTVPTMGDWFRAGGYRTFFKGKWHAAHVALPDPSGEGYLLSIDDDGNPNEENIAAYLKADLLDEFGFSEWVGPEPHGLGKHNTGMLKDVFTADETITLLQRIDGDDSEQPWLTVCSFLNPHDSSYFGVVGLMQGMRYHPSQVPSIPKPPTHDEDLSTKPACQQSYVDEWKTIGAPQPWIETHRKFHYQCQHTVDDQIARVLDALRATAGYENTIVVFSSDHGDMLGAHGGMHEKWHNAYEESIHVPFVVAGPMINGGAREVDLPTNHADLIPTLMGFAGIDSDAAREQLARDHTDARPLVGRDLSALILHGAEHPSEPLLFMTDDEISEGSATGASPVTKLAKKLRPLLDRRSAQPRRDGHRRGRHRGRTAPREALPVLRQRAILDRPRPPRRTAAPPQNHDRDRARTRRVRALRPHHRPAGAAQPRAPHPRHRRLTPSATRHAQAAREPTRVKAAHARHR